MPDSIAKTRQEQILFGDSARIVNGIADVYATKTLPEWYKQTDSVQRLMSTEGVQSALKYAQSQREIKIASEATSQVMGEALIPALQGLNDEVAKFWKENGPKFVEFLRKDLIPLVQFLVGETTKAVAFITELTKSPIFTAFMNLGFSGTADAANNGATAGLNGLNQQMVDFFNELADRAFGPGNAGAGGAPAGGTPINGSAGQSVVPGGTTYIVNATYTQADPPTPAEITRTLSLLNP
jgi:hypothetical protein